MMLTEKGQETEFDPDWVRNHQWNVVPVESMARIPAPDIPRIVNTLKRSGYSECIAVVNEPGYVEHFPLRIISDKATCYVVSVNEADFNTFNSELGVFRSILFSEDGAWAISCNELYNPFGANPKLLEALLGAPIKQARRVFAEAAASVANGNTDELLLKIAKYYAAL